MISRVKILQFPVAAPGKCVLCGAQANHDGRVYLDFGLSLKQYGAVYFCSICMAEMVSELDWTSPEKTRQFEAALELYQKKTERLEAENEHLRRALAELNLITGISRTDLDTGIGDQDDDGQQGITDTSINNSIEGRTGNEQGSSQSTDEQGRSDILGIDGLPSIGISY